MNFNRRSNKKWPSLGHSLLLVLILISSLLFVACSDSATSQPNPLTIAAGAGANQPSPASTSATTTPGGATETVPVPTNTPAGNSQSASSNPVSSGLGPGSSQVQPGTPTPVGPDNREVITLWTGGWKGNPDYEKFLNDLVDSYRAKYSKNFTLDWQDYGPDLANHLSDTFAKNSKGVPDLVLLKAGDLYQFAAADKLEDLSVMLGTEAQDRYAVPAWEAMRYNSGSISGTYALPWTASIPVSIINKKLWQTAKLDPAKLPKNFDELDQYLPSMRDYTPTDVRSVWLHPDPVADFLMEDTPLYRVNSAGKIEPAFNVGSAQGKWQYYFNRRKDGYFSTEALDGTYKDALDRYSANKLVMVMDGAPVLPDLKATNSEVYSNTLVTAHPVSKGNVLPLQIQGWAVPKSARWKRDAADFALFMDSDENQLAFAKFSLDVIPTTKKDLTDTYVTTTDEPISQARAIMAQSLGQSRPPEQLIPAPISLATRDKLLNALYIAQSATWNKSVKPQDALTEAEKAWVELLK